MRTGQSPNPPRGRDRLPWVLPWDPAGATGPPAPTDPAGASARRPALRRPRAEGEAVSLRVGGRRAPDDLRPARQDDPLGRLQVRRGAVDPGPVERGSRQLR